MNNYPEPAIKCDCGSIMIFQSNGVLECPSCHSKFYPINNIPLMFSEIQVNLIKLLNSKIKELDNSVNDLDISDPDKHKTWDNVDGIVIAINIINEYFEGVCNDKNN